LHSLSDHIKRDLAFNSIVDHLICVVDQFYSRSLYLLLYYLSCLGVFKLLRVDRSCGANGVNKPCGHRTVRSNVAISYLSIPDASYIGTNGSEVIGKY